MYRIPTDNVIPEHYDLHLNVKEDHFEGHVKISIKVLKPATSFNLNSRNLSIQNLSLRGENGAVDAEYTEKNEFLTVTSKSELSGRFTLEISYTGTYDGELQGFYKSDNEGSTLFSTHFEPTGARRALPCFDQPNMKATFGVTIDAPEGFVALSNGRLRKNEGRRFVFETTPRMSTYILAFVVGKLEYIEREGAHGTVIRVYADKAKVSSGNYALQVADECLRFFEEYFQIAYPLPKLDMVAIRSFSMGAMENWGLVTYRSTSLLYDPATTAISARKNIAVTVCHELAHMWFGNLVTMDWWSDLWLNEGFATWAATLAISNLKHLFEWDAWNAFLLDDVDLGMWHDSLKSTHRIAVKVEDPVDIGQIFDAISYSKGASLIRMVERWIGPETFKEGIRAYLKEYSYGNSTTADLWEKLNQAHAMPEEGHLSTVVSPWTDREGFPYLKVSISGDSKVTLRQERFTTGYTGPDSEPWPLPVSIEWSNGSITKFLMDDREVSIDRTTEVFKINPGFAGFYRVLYDSSYYSKLFSHVFEGDGLPADKLNLLSDRFAFEQGLYTPFTMQHYAPLLREANYEVLSLAVGNLHKMASIFYDAADRREYFKAEISKIIAAKQIDIDSDPTADITVNDMAVASLVAAQGVFVENKAIMDKLRHKAMEARNLEDIKVRPEFIRPAFITVVDERFKEMTELYRTARMPSMRQHVLMALGATSNMQNLNYLLNNFREVAPHDSIYLFSSLNSNLQFRDTVALFFIENFGSIKDHIKDYNLVRHTLELALSGVLSGRMYPQVSEFLKAQSSDGELRSSIDRCRDSLEYKKAIRENYKEEKML